jgi:hypothetical protein
MSLARLLVMMGARPIYGGVTTWGTHGGGVALADSDLRMSVAGATPNVAISTTSKAVDSGLFYAEMIPAASADCRIGFAVASVSLGAVLGADVAGIGYDNDGKIYVGGAVDTTEAAYIAGATIGLAIDTTTGVKKFWWAMNGTWQNGDPATGSGGRTYITTPIYLAASAANGASIALNCGQQAFEFEPPTGFSAWG